MIAKCVRSSKCRWQTMDLGDDYHLMHVLAAAHTAVSHPEQYPLVNWHVSVPELSLIGEIELSLYTDYSGESFL